MGEVRMFMSLFGFDNIRNFLSNLDIFMVGCVETSLYCDGIEFDLYLALSELSSSFS